MKKAGSSTKARIAVVSGVLAFSVFGALPAAAAAAPVETAEGEQVGILNWSSYLSGVHVGFQSRRWDDVSNSGIRFTGCDGHLADNDWESATIELRQDLSYQPDRSWGTRRYAWCFRGSDYESTHTWSGLEPGSHFFEVDVINDDPGAVGGTLSVDEVSVDTTP